jgi:hypothetical protein
MTEIEKDILKKFKNQLQERMPVLSIILFGSRARGDAEPGSDMDVLVLVEGIDVVTARGIASDCAWEASFGSGVLLSPIVYSRLGWEQSPVKASLLSRSIAEHGIII